MELRDMAGETEIWNLSSPPSRGDMAEIYQWFPIAYKIESNVISTAYAY